MQIDPLISIVIPTYNSDKHLVECFDSVVNQTYKNLEVIVVDGGSTDNTLKIINQYCDSHDNWKLVISQKGVSRQRNAGLNTFKGDFIYFLDSDDYIGNDLIALLLNKLLKNNLDLVTPSICYSYYDGDKLVKNQILEARIFNEVNSSNFFQEAYNSFLGGPTKLYKRELVINQRFDEKLSCGEDLLFNYHISECHNLMYDICNDAIYYYRHSVEKINPMKSRMTKTNYSFCNKMTKLIKKKKMKGKNFDGALAILKINVDLFMKAYIQSRKFIPFSIFHSRIFMFRKTNNIYRFFYIAPVIYILVRKAFIFKKHA